MSKPTPHQLLPPGLLINPFPLTVPPDMIRLSEHTSAEPVTPETLREHGVQAGTVSAGVTLHEQPLRLTGIHVQREAAGEGTPATVTFKADIAVADIINLNWRYYPLSAYEAAIARAKRDMQSGKLTALAEHPGWEDGWKGRLDAIAGRWTSLAIENREIEWPPDSGQTITKPVVVGEGVFIGTSAGDLIQTLLRDEVYVGISTNGYSSVKWVAVKDLPVSDPTGLLDPETEIPVTQDDLTFLTIDFVALPANSIGQAHREHASFAPIPTPAPAPEPPDNPKPVTPEPTPGKETVMHQKIKALCEKLGKTLEQVKAEHKDEYATVLESIVAEQAAPPAPSNPAPAAGREEALAAEIVRLQGENEAKDAQIKAMSESQVKAQREAMVDNAIKAANLPEIKPFQSGDTTIDLAKDFRDKLLAEAIAEPDENNAKTLVERRIMAQQHLLGHRTSNPNPAPALPQNDLDSPTAIAKETVSSIQNLSIVADLRN